ncbi:ribosomal protein large subunit L19 [Thermoplasma volcanium GSS1]|uniref:Large ribosomal subunit protein eL19 n=1 Tax=Thermoplasma volcanium (strain ATCC 51530 / DSM 4299 / JCM 9571 / NBRC 15438 / GSS1) TaxID=273116 RepID=Q97BV8_THEVO|nr:50S ribosomal protein L19e [Thermoplasma volcanium]BAB59489.1 ribosomal protein large subunit L19 [Thermoplasma volcanium GSS1]
MRAETVKRIVSDLKGVGTSRVYIDTNKLDKIDEAATRSDILALIEQDVVKIKQKKGISNGRLKKRIKQLSKDRRRGPGSLRGTRNARYKRKERWIDTIRALRDELRKLKKDGKIDPAVYRKYYRIIKSGSIKSRAQLVSHIKSAGLLKE